MSTAKRYCLLLVIVLVGTAVGVWAQSVDTYIFRTEMTTANEVPPITGLDAAGTGIVLVHLRRDARGNPVSGTVDFRVTYRFPAEIEFTGLHIHPGTAGNNGPVAISSGLAAGTTFPATGSINRQVFVANTNTAAFNAMLGLLTNPEGYYINIHSRANPGGVLRGQLRRADVAVFRGRMLTSNEVPPVAGVDAEGSASVIVMASRDPFGNITSATVTFDVGYRFGSVVEITGLHIHPGTAGNNGPVALNSGVTSIPDTMTGRITRTVEMTTAAQIAALDTLFRNPEEVYINLHTRANSGGAIRDQMRRTESITLRALTNSANEVPPVAGLNAGGESKVTLFVTRNASGEIDSGTVLFDSSFEFPAGAQFTGMHIHPGAAGANGPVAIGAPGISGSAPISSEANGNFFIFADVAPTDTAGVNALRGLVANPANYYINLHTTTNTGGAIRGQMTLPGEPETSVTLEPGYYVIEVEPAAGQPGGLFAVQALTTGAFSGGFNMGGAFGVGGINGFGGFNLREARNVTLTMNAQPFPGQPAPQFSLRFRAGGDEFRGAATGTTTRSLSPGFHDFDVRNTAGGGTFQLAVGTDYLLDGAVAGGFVAPGVVGFLGINPGFRQTVELKGFGKNFYAPFGAGNVILTVRNAATGAVWARAQ